MLVNDDNCNFQDLKEWNGDPEKRSPLHRRAGQMMRLVSSIEDLTTGPEFAYEYSRFTGIGCEQGHTMRENIDKLKIEFVQ